MILVLQIKITAGETKSTYGTGCFVLSNTGTEALQSQHQLLTTVAYQLDGQMHYCLEGSIFIAGAGIQWLRDGLGLIKHAKETQALAESLDDNRGVYLVPAFTLRFNRGDDGRWRNYPSFKSRWRNGQ